MPLSSLHESLIALCREAPDFVADLVAAHAGSPVPSYTQAAETSAELTEAVPAQYSADAVLLFRKNGRARLAVVVEVQRRPDNEKRWRWPQYLATVSAVHRCPAVLIVICPTSATAAWARRLPSKHGEHAIGLPVVIWAPIVIGPDDIPPIDDPKAGAQHPELAVLSMITHGAEDPARFAGALTAALFAIDATDPGKARRYNDLVVTALPAPAARLLEESMSTITPSFTERITQEAEARGLAEGQARGLAEGEARGEARSLVTILQTRGFTVAPEIREQIESCADVDQLETWIRRSITADTIGEVFA